MHEDTVLEVHMDRARPVRWTAMNLQPPSAGNSWAALSFLSLPVGPVVEWAVRDDCGALVLFNGTTRDHAVGREGVTRLEYEAYEEPTLRRFAEIDEAARGMWPAVGRIALLHRVGVVEVGESAVLVAVSAPHRSDAFEAARYCIDTLKQTAPIWKLETWNGGSAWGTDAQEIRRIEEVSR